MTESKQPHRGVVERRYGGSASGGDASTETAAARTRDDAAARHAIGVAPDDGKRLGAAQYLRDD